MGKRIISLVLALTMLVSMMPIFMTGTEAATKWDVINSNGIKGEDIVNKAKAYMGVPYAFSSDYITRTGFGNPMKFDCSGFVYRVLREVGLASSRKNSVMGVNDPNGKWLEGQDSNGNYYITAHTQQQRYYGEEIVDAVKKYMDSGDYSDLRPGDLLFTTDGSKNKDGSTHVTHVVIYAGNGKIVHCEGFEGCVAEHPIKRYSYSNSKNWFFDGCRLALVDDHVEESYRCYGELTVTNAKGTYVKTLPRSEDVDPNSKNLEDGPGKKGSTYEAIGLVLNDAGNLWYKVLVGDKTGYVYSGDVKYTHSKDDIGVSSDTTGPTEHKLGSVFNMTGTISAKYQNLVQVEAKVTTMDGTKVTGYSDDINASSYKIPGSKLDTNTKFDTEIKKEGTYYYTIAAVGESYYAKNAKEVATVRGEKKSLFGQTFVVSKNVTCSHSYTSKVTAPTYAAQGYTTYTCSKCGHSYKGNYTDKLDRGYEITFQPVGGTMPGLISTNTLDGINVDRAVAYLVVYNNSGALVDTNKYGVEVLVDSTGKVTGKRDYLSETKQYVPTGGFVLSGQGENGTWVKEIPIGAYVAYSEQDMQVYVYETKEAMQLNHKYVKENETYGALPVPTYEGHVFSGWILWGGKPINYYSVFEGEELFATWEEDYDLTPVKTMEYNGHIYELYDYNVTWAEAKALCENMGGHLVTITDAAEQEKVLALTASGTRGLYKIGASDAETEGQWKWVTGETFSYNNWDKSAPEPNGGTSENYGNLIAIDNPPNKQRGEWVDDQNAKLGSFYDMSNTGFICEYEAVCSHDYKQVVTKPTCTASGYTTYTCSKCGDSYIGSPTNALGHSYGQWTTVTAATCTKEGSEKSTCSGCGDVKTQVIPAPGHSYVSETVDATCTEYGKIIYTCTKCGDSYVEYTGGEFTDWSTTKPSGVEESQIETRTEYRYQTKEFTTGTSSTMDGWTQYDSTSSWGDYGTWSNWFDNAVTSNDSTKVETRKVYKYYYYKCPSCGDHMHGWGLTCPTWADGCGKGEIAQGDYVVVWSTTPYDQVTFKDFYGTGKYYATVDGQRVFKHSDQESKTQYRYCTREQKTQYHFYKWSDWSDWSATAVEANDNTKVETRTVYRYMTGKLGDHDYKEVITKPTCTAEGYTTFTCMECGDRYEDARVPATGHHYTYTVTQKPSEKATGALTGICDSCNDIATETLPGLNKTDYTYTVVKEPTYTETGVAKWTWNVDTYGQIAIETDLEKLEVKLTGIEIKAAPSKTKYEIGEALDTTGLTLLVRYSDGSTKTVTDGFTIGTFDSSTAGEKTVTVSYGGKTASFTVTVEKAEEPKPSAAQLVVGSATATVGSAVELDVSIANNPGFSVLNIAFVYDTQYLTLTEVENQLSSMTMTSDTTVVWDAVENYSEDGKLCTLKFEIAEDAPDGEYEIRVLFISASNEVFEELEMSGVSGTLEIRNILYGDANGDGKISSVDLAMLRKYIASVNPLTGESNIAVKAGADCNGDGKIASVDLAMLRKYLASLNPITGESTVVLGPR